jgi:hypothetical protein
MWDKLFCGGDRCKDPPTPDDDFECFDCVMLRMDREEADMETVTIRLEPGTRDSIEDFLESATVQRRARNAP